jgi:hypothetical protein
LAFRLSAALVVKQVLEVVELEGGLCQ